MENHIQGNGGPSFMGRVVGFTVSFRDWLRAGSPLRDPEETAENFEICKTCPHFIPPEDVAHLVTAFVPKGSGFCGKCGCCVSADPEALLNKLNKPTEACPDGRFPAIVKVEDVKRK